MQDKLQEIEIDFNSNVCMCPISERCLDPVFLLFQELRKLRNSGIEENRVPFLFSLACSTLKKPIVSAPGIPWLSHYTACYHAYSSCQSSFAQAAIFLKILLTCMDQVTESTDMQPALEQVSFKHSKSCSCIMLRDYSVLQYNASVLQM